MSSHEEIDVYDNILKEEKKDQLAFWSGFAIFLVSVTLTFFLLR